MLAIDHGYFQGPTTGLERVTVSMEDAARINAAAVAVQVFIAGSIRPVFTGHEWP